MRLISGQFGGRGIKTVNDPELRPAMGKTREAIFSMLESRNIDWLSARALDLFAGCGSIGLECLSRGAQEAQFVENGNKAFQCLLDNIASLSLQARARALKVDARVFLRAAPRNPFDIVFLDPPYRKRLAQQCLQAISSNRWIAPGGYVVAEIESGAEFETPGDFSLVSRRKFGQTDIYFWEIK